LGAFSSQEIIKCDLFCNKKKRSLINVVDKTFLRLLTCIFVTNYRIYVI